MIGPVFEKIAGQTPHAQFLVSELLTFKHVLVCLDLIC
jgi:hypothetical protein